MASSLNAPKGRLPEKVAAPQVSETVPTGHDHDTDHELEDLKRDVEDQRIGKIFEEGLHDANVYRRYLRTPDGKAVTGETPTVSKVDFQGNGHDEESIGLAELMDESVAEVRIEGTHRGRSYTMIGARDGLRGSFFAGGADNKGSYLPVFSGFKVEVVRRRSPEELKALKEGLAAKIAEYAKLPYLQEYAVPKEEFEAIIRVGLEQNIDPSILFSLRAVAKTEGRAFGLYDMGSASFAGQLVLVCHRLAQAAKTWEKSLGKELYDPDRRGVRYSAEFLAFAARSYGILPGHDDVLPDKDFVLKTMECYDRASGGGLYSPQEMDQAIESQVTTAVRNIGRSGDRTSTNDVITRLWGKEGVKQQLVWTMFFGRRVQVHRIMAEKLAAAQADIAQNPEADRYARSISSMGGYCWRPMVSGKRMSYHALGMAVDFDPEDNPYIPQWVSDPWDPRYTKIPKSFVAVMKKHGFRWGGDWKQPYDSMHFELPIDGLVA